MLVIYLISVFLTIFFSMTATWVMTRHGSYRSKNTRRDKINLVLLAFIPIVHWVLLWFAFDETLNHPWFNK